jgi:hypothetical protein
MNKLDAILSGVGDPSIGSPCRVAKVIDSISDPYRSKLQDLVNVSYSAGGLSDTDLAKLMQQAGLQCSATMISRHRRRVCTCPIERQTNE